MVVVVLQKECCAVMVFGMRMSVHKRHHRRLHRGTANLLPEADGQRAA